MRLAPRERSPRAPAPDSSAWSIHTKSSPDLSLTGRFKKLNPRTKLLLQPPFALFVLFACHDTYVAAQTTERCPGPGALSASRTVQECLGERNFL